MLAKLLRVIVLFRVFSSLVAGSQGHISVVLLGATGDLAKKYLWQGLFQLYVDQIDNGHSFSFQGAALTPQEQGQTLMFDALKRLSCSPDIFPGRCTLLKDQFLKRTRYWQLKTAEDYISLSRDIESSVRKEGIQEAGRLFYLSVPAFAYVDIARHINSSCRPKPGAWLRVVLEKPFGHDHTSAQQLAKELHTYFLEEEMYRVDHYLGKQIVAEILPFRQRNQQILDPIWNRHNVERVEIVLKETLDAKGRTSFYEQYGVIRDVIQNHLTEILTCIAMEIPKNASNSEEVLRNKLALIKSLQPLEKASAVIGQYQEYNGQLREELQKDEHHFSTTPTFAGVVVFIDSLRWDGVPFILTSGKVLDERVSYVRVLFKHRVFCVQSESQRDSRSSQCKPRQIVFHIGHGELKFPAVLVSQNLFKPILPEGSWKEVADLSSHHLYGQPLSDYYVYRPMEEKDAYATIITNIYQGKKDAFITTQNLMASWHFWTPLLESLAQEVPRFYPGGTENRNLLDFVISGRAVSFVLEQHLEFMTSDQYSQTDSYKTMPPIFRGSQLVTAWSDTLVSLLAQDIEVTAEEAVKHSGVFHLALSGGSSPTALLQRLATHHYTFPWKHTHLWMVDERCVPLTDDESNFVSLQENLLQHIRVPYLHIHPMPVHMNQRLCAEEDHGTEFYSKEISLLVKNTSFDLILLGMGTDGHTASIFSHTPEAMEREQLVLLTESPVKPHLRMSFSLHLINKAQKVVVLVLGKRKNDIVTLISRVKQEPQKWPITGVNPNTGQLVWYIDYEALFR
uniref:GDH/6PGL endoplasmic bifunctional protein n=1 Tax=Geotrypetes seraphini TaxID=260995 RepID=A0A6P8NPC8_GEOSA|nr:GDH/6PGL endoplasmic bifunctional protein [Geotrypetes seraphini]XP_033778030.1 GDH/6PGL endoplasmic bifunctional protein [Geotrypetes seraphini]XP_033778031.1 GDH/6PGL endoplasmic bifunctional protein [Geotrypetes seraphini]XP_033778032.1 GDH/6PGL endoplasmic bifunctional protein [Geotrypetes seraphini]